jgi:putative ABC transport system substrate-binding protein
MRWADKLVCRTMTTSWVLAAAVTVSVRILIVAGAILAAPIAVEAQRAAKVPRIGVLVGGMQGDTTVTEPLRQGFRDLGYVEGRTILIEHRFAEGRLDRFPDLAASLARLKVDVIVAPGTAAAQAARKATATIPIVLVTAGNPVGDGLIQSFARPGANVTGLTMSVDQELGGKWLELLKEAVPTVSRVAVLWNPLTAPHKTMMKGTESAATTLRLTLHLVSAQRPDEIDGAFAAISRARADGLIVMSDPMFVAHRVRIADLATRGGLPAIYGDAYHAEPGGLMSYGPNVADLFRRAAGYVDRILKGAKPADLPVERPSKFELVVNLKTAKALGVTIPPSLLVRADKVIE